MKKYDNTVLVKLRRTYSENESVMWALNKLKDLFVERGQNNAYIHELEDKVDKLEKELLKKEKQIPLTEEQRKEYDQYISMKSEMESRNKMQKELNKLRKDNKDLVGQIARSK
jgi:predicted  nucleic acid-binding Zn-ribbon protein